MSAEILAGLRGIFGSLGNYVGNPLVLFGIVLAIYLIYRNSSS